MLEPSGRGHTVRQRRLQVLPWIDRPAESNAIRSMIGHEMGYGDALEDAVGQELGAR